MGIVAVIIAARFRCLALPVEQEEAAEGDEGDQPPPAGLADIVQPPDGNGELRDEVKQDDASGNEPIMAEPKLVAAQYIDFDRNDHHQQGDELELPELRPAGAAREAEISE